MAPLKYTGHEQVKRDIANLKAAAAGNQVAEELFVPTNTPGTAEHWMINNYYPNQEALVFAIADCLHEEYKAITDAGLVLHLDDPDLPDGWNIFPDMDKTAYRNMRSCGSTLSTTRSKAFRASKCVSTSAGAASTGRITTTFR